MLSKITELIYPSGAPVLRLKKPLASEGRLTKEDGTTFPEIPGGEGLPNGCNGSAFQGDGRSIFNW